MSTTGQTKDKVFYGWWVVLATCVGLTVHIGPIIVSTFGIFLKPLSQEFGWSRTQISLAFSLATLVATVAVPFIGRLVDRFGARRVILPAVLLFGLSVLSLSFLSAHLWRFYALFSAAFVPYAVAWTVAWMLLHKWNGHVASLGGLFVGTAAMGWILTRAFDARGAAGKCIAVLFVLNTIGYYVGGWAEGTIAQLEDLSIAGLVVEKPPPMTVAMLSWGVFYGLGLGAGLGLAFYFCQAEIRARLAKS